MYLEESGKASAVAPAAGLRCRHFQHEERRADQAPSLTIAESVSGQNQFSDPTSGPIWRACYFNRATEAVITVDVVQFAGGSGWKARMSDQYGRRSILTQFGRQAEFQALVTGMGQMHRRMEYWGLVQLTPWREA